MRVTSLAIPDVLLLEPKVFGDARGFFMESYNQQVFNEAVGYAVNFVQDNHSRSARGVLRGLHYQLPPHAQGKLVRVVAGEVFDVAVDIRRGSPTFGQWYGAELTQANQWQLWIAPGLAHGFAVTSDVAHFHYKCTEYYHPEHEAAIRWDDPDIGVRWPVTAPTLSAKDKDAPSFAEFCRQQGV